jgi:hypothetical protein
MPDARRAHPSGEPDSKDAVASPVRGPSPGSSEAKVRGVLASQVKGGQVSPLVESYWSSFLMVAIPWLSRSETFTGLVRFR